MMSNGMLYNFNLCVSTNDFKLTKCNYDKNGINSVEYINKNDEKLLEIYETCIYYQRDPYYMIKKDYPIY